MAPPDDAPVGELGLPPLLARLLRADHGLATAGAIRQFVRAEGLPPTQALALLSRVPPHHALLIAEAVWGPTERCPGCGGPRQRDEGGEGWSCAACPAAPRIVVGDVVSFGRGKRRVEAAVLLIDGCRARLRLAVGQETHRDLDDLTFVSHAPPIVVSEEAQVRAARHRASAAKGAATVKARGKAKGKPAPPTVEQAHAEVLRSREVPYAYDVVVKLQNCTERKHTFVGSEKTARRKAMLTPQAVEVVSVEGMSEEAYHRTHGHRRARP